MNEHEYILAFFTYSVTQVLLKKPTKLTAGVDESLIIYRLKLVMS